jgi:SAM-dependent methyltransferase
MPILRTTKELLKFAAMRCSGAVLRHHHRAFDNSARRYMETHILPAVASHTSSRVLFVGCRSYTFHYREIFQRNGIDYWTCDIDPAARVWGERGKHVTCDVKVLDRHIPPGSFDFILLNGVFGYGVDDASAMDQTIRSIWRVLRPAGHLLIGWNNNRVPDPQVLPAIAANFERPTALGLPARKTFTDHSHVYDLFRVGHHHPH